MTHSFSKQCSSKEVAKQHMQQQRITKGSCSDTKVMRSQVNVCWVIYKGFGSTNRTITRNCLFYNY